MVWPAVIGGAALLGAAGLSTASAQSSQSRSIQAQKEIAKNQYTWAVQDLERAGLNPILAAQGGLKGASASAPPAPIGISTNMDFAGSAKDIAESFLATEKSQNVAVDSLLKLKQIQTEGSKIALNNSQARLNFQKTRAARMEVIRLATEINHLNVSIDKMEAETGVHHAQRVHIAKMTEESEKRKRLLIQQYKMLEAQIPAQERVGQLYRTWYGNVLGFIRAHMEAIGINVGAFLPVYGASKGKGEPYVPGPARNKKWTGR